MLFLFLGIIFTDSIESIGQVRLSTTYLEFAPTDTTKEKRTDNASKLPAQSICGKRKAPSFRIFGGSESQLGKNLLTTIVFK